MKKWFLIIPIVAIVMAATWMANGLYRPFRGYSGRAIVTIAPGSHVEAVADQLARNGVLAHRLPFLFRSWLGSERHETLKYGEYLFDRPLSALQVYQRLARGEVYLHAVVIPEGSDRFDMARIFERDVGLDPLKFMAASRETSLIRDIDPNSPTLEGYLFPDTYRFPRGVSASRVIQTMVNRFRQKWNSEIRPQISGGRSSIHAVMTLASLVEKETPHSAERPVIAGVFNRRLQLKMPLQCDPTVIYARRLTQNTTDPGFAPLTSADLQVNSPYNTYSHSGFPPGPICSPGVASILAALHPAPGKALYFVSNNHGGHVFADSLAQQNRNVAKYRRELRATAGRDQEKNSSNASKHSPLD